VRGWPGVGHRRHGVCQLVRGGEGVCDGVGGVY